jgi:hypothetical protein
MRITKSLRIAIVSVACAAGLAAQDTSRVLPPVSALDMAEGAGPAAAGAAAVVPDAGPDQQAGTPGAPDAATPRTPYNDPPPPPAGANAGYGNIPEKLTLPSGQAVSVRINQWLSSDRNQIGDTFYATLVQPLIVDGVVVARKGSTVMGRVSDVRKSHIDGTSRLGLQLTSISLVDGSQATIQSQVMDRNGTTAPAGQQAATVGGSTAVGAGIGAVAAGGVGAAIGAGAGLVASSVGVLLTRGRPTEVYPESMLTFQLESPVTISTTRATAAFHYADQEDYGTAGGPPARVASQMSPRPVGVGGPVYGAYPVPYPYYAPYYYSPYYYGPSFGVFIGPGYYGGFRGFRR